MEDNKELDIYYQYNSPNEINKPELRGENNFLIEYQRFTGDNLNFNKIKALLIGDGVILEKIKQILIEDNSKIKLNPLSEANFNQYKNNNQIYLHLVIDEDESYKKNKFNKIIENYKNKIADLEIKYNDISEEVEKIKNSNIFSETNIADIINGKGNINSDEKDGETDSNLKKSVGIINKEKKDLYILYLYCSVFDLKTLNYEESDYSEEIKYIYNLFKNTPNISVDLIVEPIINLINNFKIYLENVPDIIHININPNYINKELNYNNLGETINKKLEDLLKDLGNQKEISDVKLLILSILPSKKSNEILDYFKSVKTIIFPYNIKKQNEKSIFIQEFYKNLIIKNFAIDDAFEKSNHNNFKKLPSGNHNNYIDIPLKNIINENKNDEIKNNVTLNENCFLNLEFIKNNYHRVVGRDIQINECIEKIKEKKHSVLVFGGLGAGKKLLAQKVGEYFFQRNYFKNIHYIELYDLDDIEEILKNKIEQIKSNDSSIIEGEFISGFSQKILLIVIFNSLIKEKSEFRNIEDTINSIAHKNSNIIFLYTCNVENFMIEQKGLDRVKLDKLKNNNVLSFLDYINEEIFDYKEKKNSKKFKKLKKLSDYPNYFLLEAMYIKKFGSEKALKQKYLNDNKTDAVELLKDFIDEAGKEFNLKNILPIFYIIKLGLRDDILHIFFEEREIADIKNNLNYLVTYETDSEGNNYYIDGYFIQKLEKILEDKYKTKNNKKDFCKKYLLKIMENYAKIFRYIVNFSDFVYNLCKEFHAGINQGFWFSLYDSNFKDKYENFLKKQNQRKIYFDDIRYFYNIKNILENSLYFEIIKENIKDFKEYISQVVICFSTILYFKKNNRLLLKILDIFERSLTELELDKDILRLKYFKYCCLKDSSYLPDEGFIGKIEEKEKEKNKNLYNEMKFEINLIKIYNIFQENNINKGRIYPTFEECQKLAKNNHLNLIRLNIIYGIANNWKEKQYFIDANDIAKKMNNFNLILLTLIELLQYYLNNLMFDEFNEYITEYEKIINSTKEKNNILSNIKENIKKLIKQKNEKYMNDYKNKLYFYTSEPLFYEKESHEEEEKKNNLIPIKTEANNSFYLKYNLKIKIPKDMEVIFKFIKDDFLNVLENKFQNPTKFIYIGCDYFDKKGNLFYSDNNKFKANNFSLDDIKNQIEKFKNKTDMLILGFMNSEKIAKYFIGNDFPNVIYLKQLDIFEKENIFNKYPYFYFYLQRCFNDFIINFLVNSDKKTIKEAFTISEEEFYNELSKLENIDNSINEVIKTLKDKKIIEYIHKSEEENKNLFEELNVSRSNSLSNNIINNYLNEIKTELIGDDTYNEDELNKKSKEIKNKIDNNNFNFIFKEKLDDKLDDPIFDYILNKRYYANKKIFSEVINNILKHKIINIHGKENTGKSTLCFEICKYFYMNDFFKKGIYYINNISDKKFVKLEELKGLKNKQNFNQDNLEDNVLIIFDEKVNSDFYSNYVINSSIYIIIVSTKVIQDSDIKKIEKKIITNKNEKKRKLSLSTSSSLSSLNYIRNNIEYINLSKNKGKDFKDEFLDCYTKINLLLNNNNKKK